jgi:hypothetical protein
MIEESRRALGGVPVNEVAGGAVATERPTENITLLLRVVRRRRD